MLRCFIAVDLCESAREKVSAVQDAMRKFGAPVRFTDPAGMHVTLKFLGSVSEEIVGRVRYSLEDCKLLTAFEFRITGLGAFPKLDSPRVFWAGIDPQAPLKKLYDCVEEALSWMGIAEDRVFHAHLTLARVKDRKGLVPLIDYIRINSESFDAGIVTVRGFHLYQSILKPGGARYARLASFLLK